MGSSQVTERGVRIVRTSPGWSGQTGVVPADAVNESDVHFGPSEWSMSLVLAIIWGSSFLWIAIAIDHVAVTVVPLARCAFGALALALFPSARRRIAS